MMGFERLPPEALLEIFSSLTSVRDIFACSMVCKTWKEFLDDDDHQEYGVWNRALEVCTTAEFRDSPLISKGASYRSKLMVFENAWNKEDMSPNIYMAKNMLTLHRNPVAQSTDAVRGKIGYLSGQHYWTVTWHGPQLGSSAVVGVATEKERLHEPKYFPLLGSSCESWGWDLSVGVLRHDDKECGSYPDSELEVKMTVGQTIGVILDMDNRTLSFELNQRYLGMAFESLPPRRLYPAVSAVFGLSEISLVYHGQPFDG